MKKKKASSSSLTSAPLPLAGLEHIAFDFDGVLSERIWPDSGIGPLITEGADLALWYHKRGYRIVVYTARPWSDYDAIWKFLADSGLFCVESVVCGKFLAGLYVDDNAHRFVKSIEREEQG